MALIPSMAMAVMIPYMLSLGHNLNLPMTLYGGAGDDTL